MICLYFDINRRNTILRYFGILHVVNKQQLPRAQPGISLWCFYRIWWGSSSLHMASLDQTISAKFSFRFIKRRGSLSNWAFIWPEAVPPEASGGLGGKHRSYKSWLSFMCVIKFFSTACSCCLQNKSWISSSRIIYPCLKAKMYFVILFFFCIQVRFSFTCYYYSNYNIWLSFLLCMDTFYW